MAFRKDDGPIGHITGNRGRGGKPDPSVAESRKHPGYEKPDPPDDVKSRTKRKEMNRKELENDDHRRWWNQRTECICGCGNEPVVFPSSGKRGYCLNCAPDDLISSDRVGSQPSEGTPNSCGYTYTASDPGWEYGSDE